MHRSVRRAPPCGTTETLLVLASDETASVRLTYSTALCLDAQRALLDALDRVAHLEAPPLALVVEPQEEERPARPRGRSRQAVSQT